MRTARSLLFVPANNPRLLEGAHRRGADMLILDLEDSVPLAEKEVSRRLVAGHIVRLAAYGQTVAVRINAFDHVQDIQASVCSKVDALVVPKLETPEQMLVLEALIAQAEAQQGLQAGSVGVIALIETPAALFQLQAFASHPRVVALAFGSEDFALALGVPPTPECLTLPCQWIALAAAAHRKCAYGLPVSLADFSQLNVLATGASRARAIGLHGALCIHPAQVSVVNLAFSPSTQELEWARAVITAWNDAQTAGLGAVKFGGAMLDKPVVERAARLLSLAQPEGAQS